MTLRTVSNGAHTYRVSSQEIGSFDEEFDVVIAGFGFAGGIAAIEAHDAGAGVLLLEKMPDPGGLSILAGGAVRCARNADDALAYLIATNAGRTPVDVLRVLAEGMVELEAYVRKLGAAVEAEIENTAMADMANKKGGNYPFSGTETFYNTRIAHIPNFSAATFYPQIVCKDSLSGRGPNLFRAVQFAVSERRIDVRLESPVRRLITSGTDNQVVGVVAGTNGSERAIRARRGVILASGGFEADEDLKAQFWEGMPVLNAAARGNTGDGIRMAQSLGAQLWHMWHFHGVYGFKHPDPNYPFGLRPKRFPDWMPGKKEMMNVKMAWIVVDQQGQRFMNECPPYTQDVGHRPMHFMDTELVKYPRIPSFLISDEKGRQLYPFGDSRVNDREYRYVWSDDNMQEVKNGILFRANSIPELAKAMAIDAGRLQRTIDRWNEQCSQAHDSDFGRPPGTMMHIDTPPYLIGKVWPIVSNTQGGPVHNACQQVLDVAGNPIPRLYAAGELGSSFGHLYLSGGNIAECFVSGWVAGREAAVLVPNS